MCNNEIEHMRANAPEQTQENITSMTRGEFNEMSFQDRKQQVFAAIEYVRSTVHNCGQCGTKMELDYAGPIFSHNKYTGVAVTWTCPKHKHHHAENFVGTETLDILLARSDANATQTD